MHYMVQEAQDFVFLSIFSVRFWIVSLIFQRPSELSGRLFGRMWMNGKRLYLRSIILCSCCLLAPREGVSQ